MDNWWTIMITSLSALILGAGLIGSLILLRRIWVRSVNEREGLKTESERKFSRLFNTISDCIYIHSPEGVIQEVNEAAAQLFGKHAPDMEGVDLTSVVSPRHHNELYRYLSNLRSERVITRGVVPLRLRDPSRIVVLEFESTPVLRDGELASVQGIARDVTEQRRSDRSIRRSEATMKRLLDRATAMQENLKLVTQEMMRVQEEERVKISRELHDETGQLLATIRLNLKVMGNSSNGPVATGIRRKLTETEQMAGEVFGRIRQFLKDLRPVELDKLGILAALRQLKQDASERGGFGVVLSGELEVLERYSSERQTIIYRIIQESLTNIMKHAQATEVAIEVRRLDGGVCLRITDNGVGFVLDRLDTLVPHARGIGLVGMRERIELIGGNLRITTAPGKGTRVEVTIPIDALMEI